MLLMKLDNKTNNKEEEKNKQTNRMILQSTKADILRYFFDIDTKKTHTFTKEY